MTLSSGDDGRAAAGAAAMPPPGASGAGGGAADRAARALAACQVRPLVERLGPGAWVIDVGAGGGIRSRVLARAGMRVLAVEPDPAEAERLQCAAPAGVRVRRGGVEEALRSEADVWDGALMWHVLEHTPAPWDALAAARRAVRPGGWLLVATPNPASWEARVFGGRWHGWEPGLHRWHVPAPALETLLRRTGWEPVRIGARGGWGYPAGVALSLAPWLDPQHHGGARGAAGRALIVASVPVALAGRAAGRGGQVVALARAAGAAHAAAAG